MIHFLTERDDHQTNFPKCTKKDVINYCKGKEFLGFDCEFNSLNPYKATLLLAIIGDEHEQFAIDGTSVDISFLNELDESTFIGHNIKIDYKVAKLNGFHFKKVYDTMITEQRLGLGSGRRNGLDAVLERRLNVAMSKDIRKEFISMTRLSNFQNKHLEYACSDVVYLKALMDKQIVYINKFDMGYLLYGIEFPLITIMGDCDLEGFVLDEKKWNVIIEENKKNKTKLIEDLDAHVKGLILEHRPDLKKRMYTRKRHIEVVKQFDLFGAPKETEYSSPVNIQYTSSAQMKELFRVLEQSLPIKIEKGESKETVAVPFLEAYLLDNPESILKPFLLDYIKLSGINKQLSTYGESFLGKINEITGKIHTVFRHCSTDTGRFSSGDANSGFPNMQNIPADVKFRHCFGVEEGYEVTTCDLSGAELIVMVSLAKDMKLLELSTGDMHSHMANICWENIYEARGEDYTEDLHVSKKQNKHKRTAFKPMTFGSIYGMHGKKAGQQLNVSEHEGKIVVETIRNEIPDVFDMVESAGKFALQNGYVVHNTRTNSRRWFMPVMDAKKQLKHMQREDPLAFVPNIPFPLEYRKAEPKHLMRFLDQIKAEAAARNTRIQGTQSDMIKEAIVFIDTEIKEQGLDLTLLGTVHDELIYKHPCNYFVTNPFSDKERIPVGLFIKECMTYVANLYLDGVKMDADYDTRNSWTK
jgi:DNA polymerase I-like protein with 3'-5' exonuclease and polymerase domains